MRSGGQWTLRWEQTGKAIPDSLWAIIRDSVDFPLVCDRIHSGQDCWLSYLEADGIVDLETSRKVHGREPATLETSID